MPATLALKIGHKCYSGPEKGLLYLMALFLIFVLHFFDICGTKGVFVGPHITQKVVPPGVKQ